MIWNVPLTSLLITNRTLEYIRWTRARQWRWQWSYPPPSLTCLCRIICVYTLNVTDRVPHLISSLPRLESVFTPPVPLYLSELLHAFPKGCRLERIIAKLCVCDKWWRSLTQNNTGQLTCRSLICAQSPLGGVVCTALSAVASLLLMAGVIGGMGLSSMRRTHDLQGLGSSCLFGDGSCWDPVSVWCPLPGSSLLRAVITADCMSQCPALIGLSLSMRWGEGLSFVGLLWRLVYLMRTSTLWLMISLSPSDILQMDNLLHHSHAAVHKLKGTHLSRAKPHWTDNSFHHESIKGSEHWYQGSPFSYSLINSLT